VIVKILVVDDQPEFRLVLKTLLGDYGWEIYTAGDGEDALKGMAKTKMDLIISDIYMPNLDGFKLHQTVRGIPGYERLPFIFMSAYDDAYTVSAVKDPQYETFLRKTTSIEILVEWINYFQLPAEKRTKPPTVAESNFGLPKPDYTAAL
jgi:CheY-like chemotaxis protein